MKTDVLESLCRFLKKKLNVYVQTKKLLGAAEEVDEGHAV